MSSSRVAMCVLGQAPGETQHMLTGVGLITNWAAVGAEPGAETLESPNIMHLHVYISGQNVVIISLFREVILINTKRC